MAKERSEESAPQCRRCGRTCACSETWFDAWLAAEVLSAALEGCGAVISWVGESADLSSVADI